MLKVSPEDNLVYATLIGGNGYEPQLSPRVSIDTWYHLITIFDGKSMRLFVDAVAIEQDMPTSDNPPLDGDGQLTLGKRSPLPDFLQNVFRGNLDDVRFYKRVLLDSEIQDLANGIDL